MPYYPKSPSSVAKAAGSGGASGGTPYDAGHRILPPPSEHLENTITFEIFDSFTTNRICLKFKRLI